MVVVIGATKCEAELSSINCRDVLGALNLVILLVAVTVVHVFTLVMGHFPEA